MAFIGIDARLGMCVLTEFDADGFLRAQPLALGDNPQVESYELLQPYGYMARPLDPEVDDSGQPIQGKACSLLYWSIGNRNLALLIGDPRPIALLPVLGKGEQMIYGPAANFARCKADGTVTLFTTTDGTYDGQSVYCEVAPDGLTALTPWGKLQLNATGFHVLTASGARIDAGAIAGLPSPLDTLGSYLKIAADILQLEGAAVSIGSASGAMEPLAKATATLAVLTSFNAALVAIGTALTALGNSTAAAAVAATTTALATGTTAIPSASTGAS